MCGLSRGAEGDGGHAYHGGEPSNTASVSIDLNRDTVRDQDKDIKAHSRDTTTHHHNPPFLPSHPPSLSHLHGSVNKLGARTPGNIMPSLPLRHTWALCHSHQLTSVGNKVIGLSLLMLLVTRQAIEYGDTPHIITRRTLEQQTQYENCQLLSEIPHNITSYPVKSVVQASAGPYACHLHLVGEWLGFFDYMRPEDQAASTSESHQHLLQW